MEQKRALLRRRGEGSIVDGKVVISPTEHDPVRRNIVRRLLGLRLALIANVAVGVVTTLVLINVLYFANESLRFGEPSQIAENTKVQLSMSKQKLDNSTPAAQGNITVKGHKQEVDACPLPSLSIALSCLSKTNPNLTLTYPSDAKDHFLEIHNALSLWTDKSKPHCAARFCGPWIENYWIDQFVNHTTTSCLADTFGPFVPLLIPWVDLWVNRPKKFKYPRGFVQRLQSVLRPDVLYITVSQNDQGLPGNDEMPIFHNILVLSAGGYGHVPIPLLKQEETLVRAKPTNRTYLTSYVGSLDHAPNDMRQRMHDFLLQKNYTHYYAKNHHWRNIMLDSYTSLSPRGFGRTSYHLMETLQMGLIPIHVHMDVPWIPYLQLYRTWGFVATVDDLPQLYKRLQDMTVDDFREREARVEASRDSHFTIRGILHQIQLFLLGGGDLECIQLPKSVRSDDA
jgi:hypothetical protein